MRVYALALTRRPLLRWFAFWGSSGAGNEVPNAFLRPRIVEGIVQVLWSASGGVMEKHARSAGGPFENADKSRPHPHGRVESRPNWFAHPERLSHCSEIGWSKLGSLRGMRWVARAVRISRECRSRFKPPTLPKRWKQAGRIGATDLLYQGRSSGYLSATARNPLTNAVASTKKITTTSSPRVICFPAGSMHFVRCAAACLFTSEHRNECAQRKSPAEAGLEGPSKRHGKQTRFNPARSRSHDSARPCRAGLAGS